MGPTDIVIIALVLAVVVAAAVRIAGTATGKRDCCSGDVKDKGAARGSREFARAEFARAEVADKDPAHYPYTAELGIGGMSCGRCVAAVTNALESMEGTWAEVTLAGGRAVVRSKSPISELSCREVVERAGYRVVSFAER